MSTAIILITALLIGVVVGGVLVWKYVDKKKIQAKVSERLEKIQKEIEK